MPPGTVIRSFAAPAASPQGLTWDGHRLWSAHAGGLIYSVDPVTGSTAHSFPPPGALPRGLGWSGRSLWHHGGNTNTIYEIDPVTGTVLFSFAAPAAAGHGIISDGHALWHSDRGANLIYQIDPVTGTVIRSFADPAGTARGLAWDGTSLWVVDPGTDRIYQIDPVTGTVIRSFPAPGTNCLGLTWDGRTLWTCDTVTTTIFQLSVTPGASYADRVIATGPIAYWPLWEAAGTIAFDISGHSPLSEQDGTHVGVTLGQPGIGDGRTAPRYDAVNDRTDIWSAALAAAFNGLEGSAIVWARVFNVGIWADGASRRILQLRADANNNIIFRRWTVNNEIRISYIAAGDFDDVDIVVGPTTGWFSLGMTWSDSANEAIMYFNGAPQVTRTPVGTWVGALNNGTTMIGAADAFNSDPWNGYIAHPAVWGRVLSPATMLSLGVL